MRRQQPMHNFKATDTSEGQSVNGALAGEKGSKLPLLPDSYMHKI